MGSARAAPKSTGNTRVGTSSGAIPATARRASARSGATSVSVRPDSATPMPAARTTWQASAPVAHSTSCPADSSALASGTIGSTWP